MATGVQQHQPEKAVEHDAAVDGQAAGPGPGAIALASFLAGGVPDLATVARIYQAYPAERAELTAAIQSSLGNQAMTQVLAMGAGARADGNASATPAPPTTPAGPGLTELTKLIAAAPNCAPAVDALVTMLDLYPAEHEVLVDAIGSYLGDGYITQIQARMPHLRLHWKALKLVAGDPAAATGNFLVAGKGALGQDDAGKDVDGARVRTSLFKGQLTGEVGGKKGYDVSQTWTNGNFIKASQAQGGAAWKLGDFTGTANGQGVDGQYAFTDARSLKLHVDSKTSIGTLGYYRGGTLIGPELAVAFQNNDNYSVGLQRSMSLGKGVTGTVGARHWVDQDVGVGDPAIKPKTSNEKTREALTVDVADQHNSARLYAGVHPDGQFTAGLTTKSQFGANTALRTAAGIDGDKGRVSANLDQRWNASTTSSAGAYLDSDRYNLGVSTAFDKDGLHLDGTAGLSGNTDGTNQNFSAALNQRYVSNGKGFVEQFSATGQVGDQPRLDAHLGATFKVMEKLYGKVWGDLGVMTSAKPTGTGGVALTFLPSSTFGVTLSAAGNMQQQFQARAQVDLFKKAIHDAADFDDAERKALMSVFFGVSNFQGDLMNEKVGAPNHQFELLPTGGLQLTLGVKIPF